MGFGIRPEKISSWIGQWENNFDSIAEDASSIKTLVYLALLERQNKWSSYEDIEKEIKDQEVIEGDIEAMSLRNGMSQIVNALKQDKLFKIEKSKNGRQALYRIKERNQSGIKANTSNEGDIISILAPDPSASMRYVAERLMRDRRMPFYGIYLPMQAASRWVLYSEAEAEERRNYEGDQCEALLGEWLAKHSGQEISLIGLGVGEGIGEIELLERLLAEKYAFKRIHYCAIDTNIHLLMGHRERLWDRFENEIREKRLVCGVIRGNFLESFSTLIQRLQDEFKKKRQFSDLDFLPRSSGTIVSILGNLIGNLEQRASEWKYFQPILQGLKGYDLAFLLGISVHQTVEKYERDLDDLLLATPRYLTHELKLIKSHPTEESTKEEDKEFFLPTDEKKKVKRCPKVEAADYQGDGLVRGAHVTGKIYEFFYRTESRLTMELEEEILTVPEETDLLLYNIIKFDRDKFRAFLESKGLAISYSGDPYKVGQRAYEVLAATTLITDQT
jgi:hypothetical protein